MSFYRNHVYPHLVSMLGNPKPVQKIRQQLVPLAQGKVLEIGVGPGVNFLHYDPTKVSLRASRLLKNYSSFPADYGTRRYARSRSSAEPHVQLFVAGDASAEKSSAAHHPGHGG